MAEYVIRQFIGLAEPGCSPLLNRIDRQWWRLKQRNGRLTMPSPPVTTPAFADMSHVYWNPLAALYIQPLATGGD